MRGISEKAGKALLSGPRAAALLSLLLPVCAAAAGPGAPAVFQARKTGRLVGPASSGVAAHGGNYSVVAGSHTFFFLNNLWTGEQGDGDSIWGVSGSGLAWSTAAPAGLPGNLSYLSDENGWPLALLPTAPGENPYVRALWPRSAHLSGGGPVRLFYSELHGVSAWPQENFRVGQGLAVAPSPRGPYRRLTAGGSTSFWNDLQPSFGAALLEDSDGWLYLYGRGVTEPGKYAVFLARVRPASMEDPAAYRYYSADDASGWSADVSEATPVAEDRGEEFSVSFNRALGRYISVHCGEEGRVLVHQARYPWGPWEDPSLLFACSPQDHCMGAKEHPALASGDGGRIYVTVEARNVPYLYEISVKLEK